MNLRIPFLILFGSVSFAEPRQPSTSIAALYGTPECRAIVESAESMEIVLLAPKDVRADLPSFEFDGYREEQRKVLSASESNKLRALLMHASTYRWPDRIMPDGSIQTSMLGGWFGYHIRLIARRGDRSVDIGISFFTHIVVWQEGELINSAFFGSNGDQLFQIVRAIFPDDPRLLRAGKRRR